MAFSKTWQKNGTNPKKARELPLKRAGLQTELNKLNRKPKSEVNDALKINNTTGVEG